MAGGAQNQQAVQNLGQLLSQQGQSAGGGASPSFMQYGQGQGQPTQGLMPQGQAPQGAPPGPPPQGQPGYPPTLSSNLSQTQYMGGPDVTGTDAGTDMGFDKSGNDGGVGGQPTQMQMPLQQGNKPLSMSQFSPQQGLQIQSNPTSQVVQKPQQS